MWSTPAGAFSPIRTSAAFSTRRTSPTCRKSRRQPGEPAHRLLRACSPICRAAQPRCRRTRWWPANRLVAFTSIDPPGWTVLVKQPVDDAFASVRASAVRTGILILMGLVLSVLASLVLARRMVLPIRALQTGAARIGSGALDHRIEVHTGDEIEALARDFNRMAAQLSDIYGSLERKVDERTQELADTAAELKVKSQELEAASKHKSDFLANMSHELRTPLNAIIGFSQVMLEGMAGAISQEQRDCTTDILAAGRHLLSLINDILDLSKIEAGRMDLEIRTFSLARAIDDGVTMIKSRAELNGITRVDRHRSGDGCSGWRRAQAQTGRLQSALECR